MAEQTHKKLYVFLIYLALAVSALIAYEPMRHNGFVNYDDDKYITQNPDIKSAITWQSVSRAFTKPHFYMWHPLTTLSNMLDYNIYGLNPLGHHLTSLLIHIANSLLLFWLLSKMTGTVWRSAFVAAVFTLHPLQVESVAWVAERDTVLSGLFWLLTIIVYVWFTKKPNAKRYLSLIGIYVLCIMTKPVVVTLPFVLLLLDYWPLCRIKWGGQIEAPPLQETNRQEISAARLIIEKIPLLVLSAILSVITYIAQQSGGTVASLKTWSWHIRVVNALGCYFDYIIKMLYPNNLAAFYPFQEKMAADSALLAVMGVAILLISWGRGRRWLVMGLLWYLGSLVPVNGLVRAGEQLMADRYTYLPLIGVFIIIAWGAEEIFSKMRYSRIIPASGAAAALIAMVFMTRIQVGYWRDDLTMAGRAIAVTKNNYIMENHYGAALYTERRYDEAAKHFNEALRILPGYSNAYQNLCATLLAQGKIDDAIALLTEALQKANNPHSICMLYDKLGWAYEQKGNLVLAETNYRKAITLEPNYEPARNNLFRVLAKQGGKGIPEPSKVGTNLQQN